MSFECSLEVLIKDALSSEISSFPLGLPGNYLSEISPATGCLSISIGSFEFQSWSEFDRFACEFLDNLKCMQGRIALDHSVFRIAIFYDVNETVVMPLMISRELIKRISDMSFSLDVTGYPCSDDPVVIGK